MHAYFPLVRGDTAATTPTPAPAQREALSPYVAGLVADALIAKNPDELCYIHKDDGLPLSELTELFVGSCGHILSRFGSKWITSELTKDKCPMCNVIGPWTVIKRTPRTRHTVVKVGVSASAEACDTATPAAPSSPAHAAAAGDRAAQQQQPPSPRRPAAVAEPTPLIPLQAPHVAAAPSSSSSSAATAPPAPPGTAGAPGSARQQQQQRASVAAAAAQARADAATAPTAAEAAHAAVAAPSSLSQHSLAVAHGAEGDGDEYAHSSSSPTGSDLSSGNQGLTMPDALRNATTGSAATVRVVNELRVEPTRAVAAAAGGRPASNNPIPAAHLRRAVTDSPSRPSSAPRVPRRLLAGMLETFGGAVASTITDMTGRDRRSNALGATGAGLASLARGGGGSGAVFRPHVVHAEHEAKCNNRLASIKAGLYRFEILAAGTLDGRKREYRVFYANPISRGGPQAVEAGTCPSDEFTLLPHLALVASLPAVFEEARVASSSVFSLDALAQVGGDELG